MKSVSVLSLALALVLPAAVAAGATISVPGDYATIQEAVDAAVSGDEIVVKKGTYVEKVTISNQNGLVLRGKGKPVLDAEGSGTALTISDCTGVEVIGFVFQDAGSSAIHVTGSDVVSFQKCTVRRSDGDGLLAEDCNLITVERCRFQDIWRSGVDLAGGANLTENSTVVRNRFLRCGLAGVTVKGEHNVVERNKLKNTEIGILVPGDSNDILDNKVSHPVDGLWVDGSQNRVEGNKVRAAMFWGLYLDAEAAANILRQNTISRAGELGMYVWGTGNRIEENRVVNSRDTGIQLAEGAADNALVANKASGSLNLDFKNGTPDGANTLQENKFKKTE